MDTFSRILLQRIKHFLFKLADIFFHYSWSKFGRVYDTIFRLIYLFFENLDISGTKKKEIFEKRKQHFYSHTGNLFVWFSSYYMYHFKNWYHFFIQSEIYIKLITTDLNAFSPISCQLHVYVFAQMLWLVHLIVYMYVLYDWLCFTTVNWTLLYSVVATYHRYLNVTTRTYLSSWHSVNTLTEWFYQKQHQHHPDWTHQSLHSFDETATQRIHLICLFLTNMGRSSGTVHGHWQSDGWHSRETFFTIQGVPWSKHYGKHARFACLYLSRVLHLHFAYFERVRYLCLHAVRQKIHKELHFKCLWNEK